MTEIRIVALCCCFSSPEKDAQTAPQQLIHRIKEDFPSAEVAKSFSIVDKSKLLPEFKLAILESKKLECMLVIDEFAPFQQNILALSFLGEQKIPFKFLELKYLKKGAPLKCLVEYLEHTKKIKGEKISKRIKERRANGKSQGLAIAEKKKVMEVISMANYAKRFNALYNPTTTKARERIEELRTMEEWSYQKIAEQLNQEGLLTPRGNQFGSKTVERYFDYQKKLKKSFTPSRYWNIELAELMNSDTARGPFKLKGLCAGQNVHDILTFKILEKIKGTLLFTIYNSQEKDPMITLDEDKIDRITPLKGKKEVAVELNLKELRLLFPGLYFLHIEANQKEMLLPFYFYKEVLPKNIPTI